MGPCVRRDDRENGLRVFSRRFFRRRLAVSQEAAEQAAFALARDQIDIADEFGAALAPFQHDLAAMEGFEFDEKSQDKMMEIITRELPKATIVSVAHRVELEAFHSRKIVLERRKGGAKLVSDIDLIPRKGKRRLLGRFLRQRNVPKKAA